MQHGVVGEHAGPPGRPTVQAEAASAARGTVIAMMNGMRHKPGTDQSAAGTGPLRA